MLQKHIAFTVLKFSIQISGFSYKSFLLRFVKSIDFEILVSVKWPSFLRFVLFFGRFAL